jgi:hypothetical protein
VATLETPFQQLTAINNWDTYLDSFTDDADKSRLVAERQSKPLEIYRISPLLLTLSLKKVLQSYRVFPEATIYLLRLMNVTAPLIEEIVECAVEQIEESESYVRTYMEYVRKHPNCKVIVPGKNFPIRKKDVAYSAFSIFKFNTITDEYQLCYTNLVLIQSLFKEGLCNQSDLLERAASSFEKIRKMIYRSERRHSMRLKNVDLTKKGGIFNPVIDKACYF